MNNRSLLSNNPPLLRNNRALLSNNPPLLHPTLEVTLGQNLEPRGNPEVTLR